MSLLDDLCRAALSDKAVEPTPEALSRFVDSELVPFVQELRRKLNARLARPRILVLETAVSDATVDPAGTSPPLDGTVVFSTVDDGLYVRAGGTWIKVAA